MIEDHPIETLIVVGLATGAFIAPLAIIDVTFGLDQQALGQQAATLVLMFMLWIVSAIVVLSGYHICRPTILSKLGVQES